MKCCFGPGEYKSENESKFCDDKSLLETADYMKMEENVSGYGEKEF